MRHMAPEREGRREDLGDRGRLVGDICWLSRLIVRRLLVRLSGVIVVPPILLSSTLDVVRRGRMICSDKDIPRRIK